MQFVTSFIVLTILGMLDAGYLLISRKREIPVSCPVDSDCNVVLRSDWAKLLGVNNDLLGFVYYLLLFVIVLVFPGLQIHLVWITGLGFLYSLYLSFIQVYKIKELCVYCLGSALVALLLFLNSFIFS